MNKDEEQLLEKMKEKNEAMADAAKAMNRAEAGLYLANVRIERLSNKYFSERITPEDMLRLLQQTSECISNLPHECKLAELNAAHSRLSQAIFNKE